MSCLDDFNDFYNFYGFNNLNDPSPIANHQF